MGWFSDDHQDAYDQYDNEPHHARISHELLGGAAAFEAAKAYEDHCEANGQPANHAQAKEIIAGFAGAFVDREVESKGLDYLDARKAKEHAGQQLADGLASQYNNDY